MKTIRKIALSLFLLTVLTLTSFSQTYKWRAEQFTYKYQTKNKVWTDWEKWKDVNIYITMDNTKQRITVFSEKHQVYDILTNEGEKYIDGKKVTTFYCLDIDGIVCIVKLIGSSKEEYTGTNLYVEYSNMMWIYNITPVTH